MKDGACTADAVRDALENQVIFGGRLGTNLLELGAVTEEALAAALRRRHGLPSLSGDVPLDPAAVALLTPELADRHEVVPYVITDRGLALLVCDPGNLATLDEVAFAVDMRVHPVVVPEARMWALLRRAYGVERQLRGIDVHFAELPRPGPAAPAAATRAPAPDLMDESEFNELYGKTRSWTTHEPPPPAPDEPELVIDLVDEIVEPDAPVPVPAEVLASLATGPGHAPPPRFVAPTAPRAPEPEPSALSFQEALRFLEGVDDRGAIAHTVLRYARSRFRRAVLLTVHHRVARGWTGLGDGLGGGQAHRLRIALGAPGVLDTVVTTRAHFLGPLPKTEANVRLLKQLGGGVPGNALVVPVLAAGRVVNVFYGDAGRGGLVDAGGVGELLILATRITQSYEGLLARVR